MPLCENDFAGKVCLVTGSSSGIGAACATYFSTLGAKVTICALDKEGLDLTLAECISKSGRPDDFLSVKCDLTLRSDCENVVQETVKKFGRIDVLVNNAGIMNMGGIEDYSEEKFDACLAIHAKVPLRMMQLCIPYLEKVKGNIVNVCSVHSTKPHVLYTGYGAAKHAEFGLTRAAALELAPKRIRVNCVLPGPVKTNIISGTGLDKALWDEEWVKYGSKTPLGLGEPMDIAYSVGYLASNDAKWMTGSAMTVDGGYLLK